MNNLPFWFFYLLVGMLGAILGSFANVCIIRMPKDESVVRPRSHCPLCNHPISWFENIPVLSFLLLKGKCSNCREKISFLYPLVEILCIALALFSWWHFLNPLKFLAYYCLLIIPLVIISFIDLKHKIIPDIISIPGIFAGLGLNILFAEHGKYGQAALDSFLGALVGSVFLFLVAFAYEKIKKQEGLGGGDIKLIAMLGAFFGWRAAIFILLLSSILGSVVGVIIILTLRRDTKYAIPFGPFLALAGMVQLFWGKQLIHWYLHLFGS